MRKLPMVLASFVKANLMSSNGADWDKVRLRLATADGLRNVAQRTNLAAVLEEAELTDTQCVAILVGLGYITPSHNERHFAKKRVEATAEVEAITTGDQL